MNHTKRTLTLALLGSIILAVSHLPSVQSSSRTPAPCVAKQTGKEQTGKASEEREAGWRKLRHGEAGEALAHLETALKLYSEAGNTSGEAATHVLLGELYEQQGLYGSALKHFQSAHGIYAADGAGGYNANLMLAKIGNTRYLQGDLARARTAYMLMKVEKPDTSVRGKAERWGAGSSLGKKGNSRLETIAKTAATAFSTKKSFDLYR
ncbi:MAG TPA: tetratricopeptide repeat protein, partial [Pyrinomonadaceae bacterium]|nr:tetratricopeptide repeat protein [Pyrinomonadaceae bacterium]